MSNWMKVLRVFVCTALLIALCACSAQTQTVSEDELEDLNQQIASLEAQVVVLEEQLAGTEGSVDYEGEYATENMDVASLLDRIANSGETLTAFPALITGGSVSETGSTVKFDRLEYNPDYTPGGEGEDTYLLNAEETKEEIEASFAYAQFNGSVKGEVDMALMEYIATIGGSAEFTFYMLGDELVLVSEILVP